MYNVYITKAWFSARDSRYMVYERYHPLTLDNRGGSIFHHARGTVTPRYVRKSAEHQQNVDKLPHGQSEPEPNKGRERAEEAEESEGCEGAKTQTLRDSRGCPLLSCHSTPPLQSRTHRLPLRLTDNTRFCLILGHGRDRMRIYDPDGESISYTLVPHNLRS
jgi:hypothetical protein